MGNGQNSSQGAFLLLSREQLAKIIYDELSRSGFQFNNFDALIPSIASRVLIENSRTAGNSLSQMLVSGIFGSLFKR